LIHAKRSRKTGGGRYFGFLAAMFALAAADFTAQNATLLAQNAAPAASTRVASSTPPKPELPDWCRALPRPEYKVLQRVLPNEPWFEVYKVAPNTLAIYEPHQSEETIAYLIIGTKQAVLFDTGMGIGNIHAVVTQLTSRPIVVLNSHTHNDHVGDNWRFPFVFGMDTAFTRANTKGEREDAQAEVGPGQICGPLPKNFDPKTYATKPWHVSIPVHDGFKVNLGGRTLEIIATPGHTPARNGPRCVSRLGEENCGARAATQTRARRTQYSGRTAFRASKTRRGHRSCTCRTRHRETRR
jgi:hypothetical protein